MSENTTLFEPEDDPNLPDPDERPLKDRQVITQPYDVGVESLVEQIKGGVIFLRPISDRPKFQRKYVWNDGLASRLIESILLNVPIPPCYLSQNENFELDVIDGQQRLYSIFRFSENQFKLKDLEVMKELNSLSFFQLPSKIQRQIKTHTLRCVVITNQSHPEIKFDVFERLNTNTVPLNSQELRNCMFRGSLNDLLSELAESPKWLLLNGKKKPDERLRDEETVLRFFAFYNLGVNTYRTPLKQWLNDAAREGRKYNPKKIEELASVWYRAIEVALVWFEHTDCFRRAGSRQINKALYDLVMNFAVKFNLEQATLIRDRFRERYFELLKLEEFSDLIGRAVDHTKRTRRRFEIWDQYFGEFAP